MTSGARYCIVALTAISLCGACDNIDTKPKAEIQTVVAANVQDVKVDDARLQAGLCDTLHFGKMRQGEVIRKLLRITNNEPRPIVILRHATSCGCTTVNYERKPIAAGESSIIDFEFDSRGEMGWQMKLMEFYFAEKDTPLKIYIEAEVE